MSLTGKTVSDGLDLLKGKIKRLSPYALDKTLTLKDTAAEAFAVGQALAKKLDAEKVADDLVTDDPEKVLSAKQGKLLKDQFDQFKQTSDQQHNTINQNISNAQTAAENAQTAADNSMTAAEKAQSTANKAKTTAENALPKTGGTMTADLDMGEKKISNLADPVAETDAVNLRTLSASVAKSQEGKRLLISAVIPASGWIGSVAPYSQNVVVEGILEDDVPHIAPVYSAALASALLEKEAWRCINNGVASDGFITFTCFEELPANDVSIQIEVMR